MIGTRRAVPPRVQTGADADAVLAVIAECNRRVEQVRMEAAAQHEEIDQWQAAEEAALQGRARELTDLLRPWADGVLAEEPTERKSVSRPGGRIGYRTSPGSLKVTHEAVALEVLRSLRPDLIRTTHKVAVDDVKKVLVRREDGVENGYPAVVIEGREPGERIVVPGLDYEEPVDRFYAAPKRS